MLWGMWERVKTEGELEKSWELKNLEEVILWGLLKKGCFKFTFFTAQPSDAKHWR